MIRKTILIVISFGVMVLLYGCSQGPNKKVSQDKVERNYNLFEDSIELNDDIHGKENDVAIQTDETTDITDEDGQTDVISDWPYELTFHGLGVALERPLSGNMDANFKRNIISESNLICPDEERNCIYYINYGGDSYIYQWKENNATLLVRRVAAFLQLWQGKLYYVDFDKSRYHGDIKTFDDSIHSGDIYSYDIETGIETLILKSSARNIHVFEDGIYFNEVNVTQNNDDDTNTYTMTYKLFRFDNNKVEDSIYPRDHDFKDFVIVNDYDSKSVTLYNKNTGASDVLAQSDFFYRYRVYDDYFCLRYDGRIYMLNLRTGERKNYDINYLSPTNTGVSIQDFILYQNKLYATLNISGRIAIIDLNTDKVNVVYTRGNVMDNYQFLYIGNGSLYTLTNLFSDKPKVEAIVLEDGFFSLNNMQQ